MLTKQSSDYCCSPKGYADESPRLHSNGKWNINVSRRDPAQVFLRKRGNLK